MIAFEDVSKNYPGPSGIRTVLNRVNFTVQRGEKVALFGRNGAGKSTAIRLISGVEKPSSGTITREMSISWPLGLDGGFHGTLTGNDNIRFISRVYGRDPDDVKDEVDEFAELGRNLSMPVKTYSMGMRARLAFGISLAIDFDCYLIDEIISVGDQRFQKKSRDAMFEGKKDKSIILASHDMNIVREYCSKAIILHRGKAKIFNDIELAIDIYTDL